MPPWWSSGQSSGKTQFTTNKNRGRKILVIICIVMGKNIMTTFCHSKGQVLKRYCGHHLLLLWMIIYSTPVLGAPVISLPEKQISKLDLMKMVSKVKSKSTWWVYCSYIYNTSLLSCFTSRTGWRFRLVQFEIIHLFSVVGSILSKSTVSNSW